MKPIYYCLLVIVLCLSSCEKYLEKKTDDSLTIPNSLNDFQGILEMDNMFQDVYPFLPDEGCDDYFVESSYFLSLSPLDRACYTWESDIYKGQGIADWSRVYSTIYRANIVLEGLQKNEPANTGDVQLWNNIYGRALFIRAFGFLTLEEGWGQPYKLSSNATDLGIPIKLTTNLTEKTVRATVKQVFDQVLNDVKLCAKLLPYSTLNKNFPTKASAFALAARTYLIMQDYVQAGKSADSSLKINNALVDYNTISASSNTPFTVTALDFPELLYSSSLTGSLLFRTSNSNIRIDTSLYNSYSTNDLRKTHFFRLNASTNSYFFKGKYTLGGFSNGPAIDEMYLVRAECNARGGNTAAAMKDLNDLLKTRWRKNTNGTTTYVDQVAASPADALNRIITERRKELVFRGLRWMDLRRLNQDPQFAITLKRILSGVTYTLAPNDPKYALPIPPDEMVLSSMLQNPR